MSANLARLRMLATCRGLTLERRHVPGGCGRLPVSGYSSRENSPRPSTPPSKATTASSTDPTERSWTGPRPSPPAGAASPVLCRDMDWRELKNPLSYSTRPQGWAHNCRLPRVSVPGSTWVCPECTCPWIVESGYHRTFPVSEHRGGHPTNRQIVGSGTVWENKIHWSFDTHAARRS
jgi:hypothetical protein